MIYRPESADLEETPRVKKKRIRNEEQRNRATETQNKYYERNKLDPK